MSSTLVPIGSLCRPISTWNPARDAPDRVFTYVDITAVDREHKVIGSASQLLGRDAPSRARQLIAAGDVLVSTVRPNLNAVSVVPAELDGATASTGFSVLRPEQARLHSRYLYHWVRHPSFVREMT